MIKSKEKSCRGTGPALGSGCGKPNTVRTYGLGHGCRCYQNWLLTSDAGKEVLNKRKLSASKKVSKEKKIEEKEKFEKAKFETKTIRQLIGEARVPFQKLIRIRDHGKTCICCDKPLPFNIGDYDAGHCFKAEVYTGIIFHPHNVNGQLVKCNQYDHGNESGYAEFLKIRIGDDAFTELKDLALKTKQFRWDKLQLVEMKEYYSKQLKLVEKGVLNINEVDFSIGIINL